MPLGGGNIGWDEASPPDSESAALGNERIQSIKTSVRIALDSEHVFSASGGTVGAHRRGSALPFVGLQSNVSSADTDGRMMIASDTSRLFGVGSGGTVLLGAGPTAISAGTFPGGLPQRSYWVEEFGLDSMVSSTGSASWRIVSFPNSGYSGAPYVFISGTTSITSRVADGVVFMTKGITATQFVVGVTDGTGGSNYPGATFMWRSIGTRAL